MLTKLSKYVLLICLVVFQFSCDNESVEDVADVFTNPLEGTWDLITLEGGDFSTGPFTWNPGERTLTFDTVNNTLTFVDNLNPDTVCPTCNFTHDYVLINETVQDGTMADFIYFVSDDGEGNDINFPFGWIDTLTEEDLVIKMPGLFPTEWTLTKAE